MALSELIKYEGDNQTFVWKFPGEDFNCMTELVVHESQEAVFFANGQAADHFGPGRYRLDAKNLPILTHLLDLVTGVAVFHCEVYFINKTVQMAVKWGTDSKVRFVEPTLGVPLELGASGEMNLEVFDGVKLLVKLVGTMKGIAWENEGEGFTQSLKSSFKPLISTEVRSNLSGVIKQRNIDVVEVDEHLTELSESLRERLLPGFEEYGLTIPQFYLTNVVLPEEDPNFRKLRELHTLTLQKRMAEAEAEVKVSQAESKKAYMTAEAEAEASIKAAQREAILEAQTTENEIARKEAERKVIQAEADAQAAKMAGMAEAEVMQAKGYNQKDVLQAEVQKAYAEGIGNMGSGASAAGGSGLMGDMVGLGVGMAAMGAVAPKVGEMMKGMNMGASDQNSAAAGTAGTASAGTVTCPSCGNTLPAGAKFCMECGKPLSNKCPACGAELPAGAKFCLNCGARI